jgi:hypothetical protein
VKLLEDVSPDIREAAVLVASELAENVVKYGEPIETDESGEVNISLSPTRLMIASKSGLADVTRAQSVVERIGQISTANARDLYTARLRALFDGAGPSGSSELGLLRIVFEAEFRLSASHDGRVLTITAERDLA